MTISSTASEISYAGDGSSTAFAVPFPFDTSADLKVLQTDTTTGAITTLTTGFVVSGGSGSTGTVTFSTAPASGYTITILDDPALTQPADYTDNDAFPATTHERALDRTVRQVKRLYQQVRRSIRTADGDPITDMTLGSVDNRKGKYLFFNAITGAIEYAVSVVTTTLSQSIIGQLLNPQTSNESAAGITPVNYWHKPGNIRRYGAVVDGTTNDAAAVRKAIDLAARDGTTVHCDPPGVIKVSSVIYLPPRSNAISERGYKLEFYGSTFIGQGRGTGTIFESGMGSTSTGGATNFGQPNESVLHYATKIAGAQFKDCDTAIRLFNFIMGCRLDDLYFENVDQAVYTDRCFYLGLYNCRAQVSGLGATDALFDFNDTNNAMVIMGCTAAGGAGGTTGYGFMITGGGDGSGGIIFHGNTAEILAKGLVINSSVESLSVSGCYFEGLGVGIDGTAGGGKEFSVGDSWFYDCAYAIDVNGWTSGTLYASNHIQAPGGLVRIDDTDSKCTVEIPVQIFSEAQSATAAIVPASYTLSNTVHLAAPRVVYVASSGLGSPIAVDRVNQLTVPDFHYSGGTTAFGASFTVPFCAQTLSLGSSIIDTQITWNTYHMHVYFGFYTEINGVKNLAGIVGPSGGVYRFDVTANITVTASNNGGKLRLTVSGSAHTGFSSNGFWGQVRHL